LKRIVRQVSMEEIGKKPEVRIVIGGAGMVLIFAMASRTAHLASSSSHGMCSLMDRCFSRIAMVNLCSPDLLGFAWLIGGPFR
ncbi:MAG: hypothetical protein ACEQSK_20415, partial [Sphingomonadaceae bacterium]